MRIAMVVTPVNRSNLKLAAQIGVTDIVGRYPGPDLRPLLDLRDQVEEHRMKLSVIEGYLPMQDVVVAGPRRDEQIELVIGLIRNMARASVKVLCYNFMHSLDMIRTSHNERERAGAVVNGFDHQQIKDAPANPHAVSEPQRLWDHLEYFLKRVIPVCEDAGVKLAMHPDDPPMTMLRGEARIMSRIEDFERLVQIVPSPANGICFCGGCFSAIGVDVPAAVRQLGRHITYVHFRDVVGCVPKFREAFHDNGQTNMYAVMKAYKDIGFSGVMRPDHVPKLEGETGDANGYTMLGRLFAVGYMRGLMHAVERG